jgi:hypothetical protein
MQQPRRKRPRAARAASLQLPDQDASRQQAHHAPAASLQLPDQDASREQDHHAPAASLQLLNVGKKVRASTRGSGKLSLAPSGDITPFRGAALLLAGVPVLWHCLGPCHLQDTFAFTGFRCLPPLNQPSTATWVWDAANKDIKPLRHPARNTAANAR